MDIRNSSTQEIMEFRDALNAQNLAEFRTTNPESMTKEQRTAATQRGFLVEDLNGVLKERSDYPATAAARGVELRQAPPAGGNDQTPELPRPESRSEESEYVAAVREKEQRNAYSTGGPNLTNANRDLADKFRDAIINNNPAPITVPVNARFSIGNPAIERRDLLKTTATQALPTDVYGRIVTHMVENSAVLRAGATVINTESGADLVVPRSTAFSTSTLTAEAASITESDPTLGTVTLKAYKYATYFEVSHELANDTTTDLLDWLARQAGTSLALAYGPHLITGTGSGQPQGVVTGATLNFQGPTGTATSFGTQSTAAQGTDVLWSTLGTLAEPYVNSPSLAWIMRNAAYINLRKLKDSAGNPVAADLPGNVYVDPFLAAPAASNKSVVVGDFSRYFVRIAEGIRFERSDDFRFQNDLVAFRAVIRLDAAVVDANAFTTFQQSAA